MTEQKDSHLEGQHLVEDGLPFFLGLLFGLGGLDLFAKLADLGGNFLFLGHLGVRACVENEQAGNANGLWASQVHGLTTYVRSSVRKESK